MDAARRLYSATGGKDEDLSALGIPAALSASFVEADFEVWGENWPAFELFTAMNTQWRVGMSGATGLDYSVLPVLFETLGIKDRAQAFRDMQVMENEALKTMRENNGK